MRIARAVVNDGGVRYLKVDAGHGQVIEGDLFGEWSLGEDVFPLESLRLLAPVQPLQILAIGRNYRAHAQEGAADVPTAPLVFMKGYNTVIGPDEPIILPQMAPDEVDYEAELVVVMGRRAKNISESEADDYVLGFTCGNDVSARDCQLRLDKQWIRGKGFDTFAPLGPWIETKLKAEDTRVCLDLNGERMQDGQTADMIFSWRYLVSYLSQCMTLEPGSVIFTGTPAGVGHHRTPPVHLKAGDDVSVTIDGIGTLTNPVVLESSLAVGRNL